MRKKVLACFLFLFIAYGVSAQVSNNQTQVTKSSPKKPANKITVTSNHSSHLSHSVSGAQIQKKPVKKFYTKTSSSALTKKNIHSNTTLSSPLNTSKNSSFTINGQWRGYFDSNGDIVSAGNDNIEYVLELDIEGSKVSGYSYSYFQDRSFYVICSLGGEYNKATKSLTVTETARIKGSTPPGWNDCLQMHTLIYKKINGTEELTGSWKMAPGQMGDCGFGNTTLVRKTLIKDLASYNKSTNSSTPFSSPKHTIKTVPKLADNKKAVTHPVIKSIPKVQAPIIEPPVVVQVPVEKNIPDNDPPKVENDAVSKAITSDYNFEKRNNELMQTVEINHVTFRVDLYDNGVIDGDSISLFYNGKLILTHRRLSDTAITLTLNVNTNRPVNELIMYAENLGEIPPNTALMVVTDGENRYEVPVTSDLQTSGTVHFVFKPKNQ